MAGPPLRCAGCGAEPPPGERYPFRCAAAVAGDDVDHLLVPALPSRAPIYTVASEANPFLRYRHVTLLGRMAEAAGLDDAATTALVKRLDAAVAAVWGRGFRLTPLMRSPGLSADLGLSRRGGVFVKDETGNVSGSHKARHLFGVLLHLALVDGDAPAARLPRLAIASCGNAALAAAVVARAAGRALDVYIPTSADAKVVARLESLGASLHVCARTPGVAGDPCYLAFRAAVAAGALPFSCQGPDNGLTLDGGATLGHELIEQGFSGGGRLDAVFLQVGGGALASSVIGAFRMAHAAGALARLPRFHAVQTAGAYPLVRAYQRVRDRILARLTPRLAAAVPDGEAATAALLREHAATPEVKEELGFAATHRSQFMWPWESEPHSVAHGILDDETYDWLAVVEGMIVSGGWPIVVDEPTLHAACARGRAQTGIAVDETGSAGLAGLMTLARSAPLAEDESIAVVFSGVRR